MRTARDRVWPLGGQPLSEPTFESGERESAGFGRRAFESSKSRGKRLRPLCCCCQECEWAWVKVSAHTACEELTHLNPLQVCSRPTQSRDAKHM